VAVAGPNATWAKCFSGFCFGVSGLPSPSAEKRTKTRPNNQQNREKIGFGLLYKYYLK
jgi:hypothetical protein